jgi:NitT/TauT family transport system substrate-binding protein
VLISNRYFVSRIPYQIMMQPRPWLLSLTLFCLSLVIVMSCRQTPDSSQIAPDSEAMVNTGPTIVLGYSSWPGWWPWAIAEQEGLFAKNNVNVQLKWFDSYIASMEALAAGQLDGNCQTLNDTISFAADAINGEVAVLVNDNSAGNDKLIATSEIQQVKDLRDKKVALEAGIVDDFLLALILEKHGMSRRDVQIVGMDTDDAATAFVAGKVDAVAAFPPFWAIALARPGSHELASSADFPGAIPDLLVVTQTLINHHPELVQGLVNTWFDVLAFMRAEPDRADAIMAARANIEPEDLAQFKAGTKLFSIEDNLKAFSEGDTMEHMPFAAEKMLNFMLEVGFIPTRPPLDSILDNTFVQAYADRISEDSPTSPN